MRARVFLIPILLLTSAATWAQYKSAPASAAPALPTPVAAAIDPAGIAVTSADGKTVCEMWFARSIATGPKSAEDSVSLPTIAHGAFLGVVRFPAQASDRRGNPVKAGTYAMRYSTYPADGNHMGAAPQRDFAVLVPVEKDKAPDVRLDYNGLMQMVKDTMGQPHPSVFSLAPSSESEFPSLKKEGERDWTLHVKAGGQAIAIIVVGRTEG